MNGFWFGLALLANVRGVMQVLPNVAAPKRVCNFPRPAFSVWACIGSSGMWCLRMWCLIIIVLSPYIVVN